MLAEALARTARARSPRRELPGSLPDGVSIACCDLDDDAALPLDRALEVLSADERDRAVRFRRALDATRFLRGRAFLRLALARAMGLSAASLAFLAGPNGKPALAMAGAGRAMPEFNLSHSAGLAVLALSSNGPVGIDVELLDRSLDPLQLAPSVLTGAETAALRGLEPKAQRARFLSYWTAKEALLKHTGDGLSTDPRTIALALEDGRPTGFTSHPDLTLTVPRLARLGSVCALVTGGPARRSPDHV